MSITRLDDNGNKVTFPLWRKPQWKNEDGTVQEISEWCDELFNEYGLYIGLVKPFGTIWQALKMDYDSGTRVLKLIGLYYTKDLARQGLEIYFGIKESHK